MSCLSLFFFCARRPHMVTEYMGIRNESFMKIAAVGTWMGDFVTAWMVRMELLGLRDSKRKQSFQLLTGLNW